MSSALELLIERPVAGGEMLARHNGQVVLVRGVIPGERVRARILRHAKGVVRADLVEVLDASPDRRPLPFDPGCGGAHYAHIDPARQRALKAEVIADAFRRIGKMSVPASVVVRPSPEAGYRLRARLHVRGRDVGFFRDGTHTLCDAGPSRQLQDDSLSAARRVLARMLPEADHCEAMTVAEDTSGHSRVIHLHVRPDSTWRPSPDASWLVEGVTGVTAQSGQDLITLAGSPVVVQTGANLFSAQPLTASPIEWAWRPTSFFQGNRFLLGSLVLLALERATGDLVADLYAGVGLFAVTLAARGAHVLAVEGDTSSGADLLANLAPHAARARGMLSAVERAVLAAPPSGLETAIVDPPRTGMSAEAVDGLIRWKPRRIVYVSCDPPTLARDAKRLGAAAYTLTTLEAFDFFPNSPHVEAVAVFEGRG